jgi:hypothetical protein
MWIDLRFCKAVQISLSTSNKLRFSFLEDAYPPTKFILFFKIQYKLLYEFLKYTSKMCSYMNIYIYINFFKIILRLKLVRFALCWAITRRRMVIVYRRFGTTYHGSRVRLLTLDP